MCSIRILSPIVMRITPPTNSAFFLYWFPNMFPILNPTMENRNVVIPIIVIELMMSVFRNAKETPAARASMLVATAKTNSALIEKSALFSSSSLLPTASLIMLPPIIANSANAIQWSKSATASAKL